MIKIWMKKYLAGDNDYHIVGLWLLIYKEWKIMLGSHLVFVALHGRFTISVEQDKKSWWH